GSSNNTKTEPEFEGRVSLLEPDLKKKCSIIINDLTKSDSGSYHAVAKTKTHCTLIANITVTLSEKPTLEIPEITEGEQTTLTCSAPGLCSGSTPNITWIWSGSGQNFYEIKENNIEFQSEDMPAFNSTLTFNASTKHNGGQVTCKVTFKNVKTNETKTLNVKYAPKDMSANISSNIVKEGESVSFTCSAKGQPEPTFTWTKDGRDLDSKANWMISSITASQNGSYICKAVNKYGSIDLYLYCALFLYNNTAGSC
uniref:Ig-like domain-containing protein n=1 Tax=Pundamilia nyererei TaxID=303518 RepID=A0A3B4G6V1_9CICH